MAFARGRACLCVLSIALFISGCETTQAMKRVEVGFQLVEEYARKLSERPYEKSEGLSEELLRALDYDAYRRIAFNEDSSLWRENGAPFQVQFFHQGYLFSDGVRLNEFTETHSQQIPFVKSFFRYDSVDASRFSESDFDYAGFKVLYPLKGRGESFDEILSFLGASYFRSVGSDMHYGMSARGLAIDSGLSTEEEFPRFTEFWLGKPKGESTVMTIYALLDSPSVVGAYEFVVAPGANVRIEVKAKLFMRSDVDSFGVAPMTSMFWYGENSNRKGQDYRPEIHDTDGLLFESNDGSQVWRPLEVGDKTRLSFLALDNPKGFGLLQRDRGFQSYQDLEAEYHKRPSLWIVPKGEWGKGHLKLVELPTRSEFDDNVVAFWEPKLLPSKGDVLEFSYTMHWTLNRNPAIANLSIPAATRVGYDLSSPGDVLFVVDFEAPEGVEFDPSQVPEIDAKVLSGGSLSHVAVRWNAYASTWRVTLRMHTEPDSKGSVELESRLVFSDSTTSETWKYQWTP